MLGDSLVIDSGKELANMSSMVMTKPRATKLLMIMERSPVLLMAIMRDISVTSGEHSYMEAKIILIALPLFPPLAVFTYLRYLSILKACLTSL